MDKSQPVTLAIVARQAKVSVSTASNVLTGNRSVAEPTRRRVLEAAARLGYQPNRLARGLVSRSSSILGVVASHLDYYGPAQTLIGIEEEASQRGFSLLLSLIHAPENGDVTSTVDNLLSHQVDGVIWAIPQIGENRHWWETMQTKFMAPIVFIDSQPIAGTVAVSIDNFRGGFLATQHLLEIGCRKIGIITGPPEWLAADERRRGWCAALAAAGVVWEEEQSACGDWTLQSGARAFRELMQRIPTLDGVFVGNDQMAMGALHAARQLQLRVPDEVALVGYDDIPEAAFVQPELTTVRQPTRTVGRRAVAEVIRLMDGGATESSVPAILLTPELIVRASSRRRSQLLEHDA